MRNIGIIPHVDGETNSQYQALDEIPKNTEERGITRSTVTVEKGGELLFMAVDMSATAATNIQALEKLADEFVSAEASKKAASVVKNSSAESATAPVVNNVSAEPAPITFAQNTTNTMAATPVGSAAPVVQYPSVKK